ncbi:MAG: HEPN domain-containing protein [Hahellaceae bacterium]|nr:HEPN domain-containing protein [Hahellaceae bacterium]MCP5168211.1 HEPN domain-containing protein [Hahellaceae bacterium]
MTLDNLIGKTLEAITPDAAAIKRLLEAAARNIADAKLDGLSNENKFDMAYKAIMQLANAALQASGYRTLTSKPGHHQTMIQSLPKTVGLAIEQMIILDSLRKQRNVADYSGDLVTESAMQECLAQAASLYEIVSIWLAEHHSEIMGK